MGRTLVSLALGAAAAMTVVSGVVAIGADAATTATPPVARGLQHLVDDYRTRTPAAYTAGSWAPFAKALTTASAVASDGSATESEVASAKTALMDTAATLAAADEGTFATITNDTFWKDTSGNPIYSQGGGVFRFGDTYYWYGVHYLGAEHYAAGPTKKFDGEVTFVSIPVYSSRDLVNWKFENNVATTNTTLPDGTKLGGWVGRLGVSYNEKTGKYILVVQGPGGVVFLRGDTPTGTFVGAAVQAQITNSPTAATGDQTVFTDDDGKDYLVFSNSSGRSHAFISKLRESDSLYAEPAVEIGRCTGCGREGNAMFKLDGKYYYASSDLHGWNASVAYVYESTGSAIQGTYSTEYVLPGTEADFSHVTQTGFFVTVKGTKATTVIFAGDRWSDFAWNGIGYNQWLPVTKSGSKPQFNSLSQWQFNATTGEWRAGAANNYIRNPDVQADRVITTAVTGWTTFRESGASAFSTNVKGGANGSQYALQIGTTSAYAGGVRQSVTVPAGTYRLALQAKTSGTLSAAQVTVTDASGAVRTLNVPASSGWTKRELTGFQLAAGTATVTVRAASSNGYLFADQLELVRTSGDPTTTTTSTSGGTTTTTTTRGTTTTTTTTTTTGSGTAGCTAAYSVASSWDGGFVANVTVTAGSAAISGWRVNLTLPGGTAVTSGWNATLTGTTGTVTAANASYNGALAAGQSTSFGFQGTGTGTGVTGVGCTVT